MVSIQPRARHGGDKELRSVRIRAAVRHGKDSRSRVLQREVLVRKALAVDRLASTAVSVSEVTSLRFTQTKRELPGTWTGEWYDAACSPCSAAAFPSCPFPSLRCTGNGNSLQFWELHQREAIPLENTLNQFLPRRQCDPDPFLRQKSPWRPEGYRREKQIRGSWRSPVWR